MIDEVETEDVEANNVIETRLKYTPNEEIHAWEKFDNNYENPNFATYHVDTKDLVQPIHEDTMTGKTDKSVKVKPVRDDVAPEGFQGIVCPEKKSLLFGHYFSRLGPHSSICLVCGKQLASSGSNKGLISHIQHCHKDKFEEYTERRKGMREDSRGRLRSQPPSLIWGSYFEKVDDGKKGKCNTCEYELNTRDGSTTGMLKHMKAKHWEVWLMYSQQMKERREAKAEEKAKEYVR